MLAKLLSENLYSLTARYNDLIVPVRSVEDFLARFCTSLGVLTDDDAFPIYAPGSATLLKYAGRYFMVCTRHQLANTANFEHVGLMLPLENGQTEIITSGRARWSDQVSDGDHLQVALFDFTEPCNDRPELRAMFFDFRGQHADMLADQIVTFIVYGFPTSDNDVDYQIGKFAQKKRSVLCKLGKPGADNALHSLDTRAPLDFEPDGMSGGPAFCLVRDGPEGVSIHLAGVTVRGGRNRLMVIKSGAIQSVMNTFFQHR